MPLEDYQAKRDFETTPEPSGGEPAVPGQLGRFVVQQHHATAMHWDFRLELDGVLVSWAVPKGPSLDTKDKRLAVHVEDHPLDYADFEGTIPKGEYGGGTVIVWDRGTWEPLGDPHAGLAKGDFKFHLNGQKLQGIWVLVRLKPRAGEKRDNWLLIKERDDFVRPRSEYDITIERPESLISGRKVDEIGEDDEDVDDAETPVAQARGRSGGATATPSRPAPAPVPGPLVAPPPLALCTLVTEAPKGAGWLGEVKYDGYRVTIAIEDGKAVCHSRSGEDMTRRLGPVGAAAATLPVTDALIDGEAVVFDERGMSSFGALQSALSQHPEKIVYAAFDLLHLNGYDLRPLPTTNRKDLLRTLLAGETPASPLRYAAHVEGDVPALMEVACAQGLEGVVAKRADAPYPRGRTRSWLKVKCRRSQEFVIGGFTEPEGGRHGFGALLVGYYDAEKLVFAGRVGSGFSDRQLTQLSKRLGELETAEPPFDTPIPPGPPMHWVEPLLVASVAFAEWTTEGVLRQPSFLGLREDIDPRSVALEVPVPPELPMQVDSDEAPITEGTGPDIENISERPSKPTSDPVVQGVSISNPGKQLFPSSELGKVDLAHYYEAIAPLMLPEVAERPLTLVRCPVGGGAGGCFYQRHPDRGLAAQVQVLKHVLPGHDDADEWLYVNDAAGLVALAQMGAAEIHTWLSRTDAPRRPDRIIFDLDPGPDVSWGQIVRAATTVRDECDSLGFTPFVKSTGSKGLHVVLPIEPVWDFERIRAMAHRLAERIAGRHPTELTPKMAKIHRPGRIFIDYVRNSEGASAVAPYSTRYLEGPPIAVPLEWDELKPRSDVRRRYTPAKMLKRMKDGIDPWKDLEGSSAGARILKAAEKTLSE